MYITTTTHLTTGIILILIITTLTIIMGIPATMTRMDIPATDPTLQGIEDTEAGGGDRV